MKTNIKTYIALHIFLMIYSTAGILSKLASGEKFMSLPFVLFYVGEIIILAFYAIGWQQFIKRMPLSVAYANKAVTVVWGCIWGVLFFQEHLSAGKIIGAVIVLAGVALYGYADGKMNSGEASAASLADSAISKTTDQESSSERMKEEAGKADKG